MSFKKVLKSMALLGVACSLLFQGNAFVSLTVSAQTAEAVLSTSYNEDVPVIGEGFEFEIPYIEPSEVVLIGRIVICPDNPFTLVVSVDEEDSDYGFFLALNESPYAETLYDTTWNLITGSRELTGVRFNFASIEESTAYLYIGGGFGGVNLAGNITIFSTSSQINSGTLTNITGEFYIADE